MPVLKILQYPDPVLRKKSGESASISDCERAVIRDLVDTLRASLGVGLAAPQIGFLRRIIAVDVTRRTAGCGLIVLVNPVITRSKGLKTVREGCLSIPEYTADIKRAEEVTIKGLNPEGTEVAVSSKGLEAVALQHELDHLDGILFIDRIENIRSLFKRKAGGRG